MQMLKNSLFVSRKLQNKYLNENSETVLGYQLTLFGPRGADYDRHILLAPLSFWMMRRLRIEPFLDLL